MHTGTQRDGRRLAVDCRRTPYSKKKGKRMEDEMLGEKLCEMGCAEDTCIEGVG